MNRRTSYHHFFIAVLVVLIATVTLCAQNILDRYDPRFREEVGPGMTRILPSNSPYDRWIAQAKKSLPIYEGILIQNIHEAPLKEWPEMGGKGLYIRLADYQITDANLLEIPANGSLKPHKHFYEEVIYFLGGPGYTLLRQEGKRTQRVEWQARSLFSVPLNVPHQHFNTSDKPVRYLAVTSFPYIMNTTNNIEFVSEDSFTFRDRYNAQEDFLRVDESLAPREWKTNLVKDVLDFKLDEWDQRGEGSTSMHWDMAGDTMLSKHVSEVPPRLYKKAHRHTSDAFILMLSGKGYSLTWPAGGERKRVDWEEGTLFVPPIYWYHQHLNPCGQPARYLAINAPGLVTNLGLRFEDQIENDDPAIEAEFDREVEICSRPSLNQ